MASAIEERQAMAQRVAERAASGQSVSQAAQNIAAKYSAPAAATVSAPAQVSTPTQTSTPTVSSGGSGGGGGGGGYTQPQQSYTQPAQQQTQRQTTTPTQQNNSVGLRDVATNMGYNIQWDANTNTASINGVPIDVTGLTNENGRYVGSQQAVQNAINKAAVGYMSGTGFNSSTPATGLRESLEKQGIVVGYDNKTGQVTANGQAIDTSNMALIDGRYYGKTSDINNIVNSIKGNQGDFNANEYGDYYKTDKNTQSDEEFNQMLADKLKEMGYMPIDNEQYADQKAQIQEYLDKYKEYQDQYSQKRLDLYEKIQNKQFNYNPSTDQAYQNAKQEMMRSIEQELNSKGILNSTITADRIAQALPKLQAEYETVAYNRYQNEISNMFKSDDMLQSISNNDYKQWSDSVTNMFKSIDVMNNMTTQDLNVVESNNSLWSENLNQSLNQRKQLITEAKERTDLNNYVSNEDSAILGVPAGTPSKSARERIEKQEDAVTQAQLEVNKQNTINKNKIEAEREDKEKDERKLIIAEQILLELENVSADEAIKQLNEQQESLAPYVGKYIGEMRKSLQERKKSEASQRTQDKNAETARINATKKPEKSSEQKKGTYFDSIKKSLDDYTSTLASTEYGNGTLLDQLSIPGTVEHKRFTTAVLNAAKNGMITEDEVDYLYDTYGVPKTN